MKPILILIHGQTENVSARIEHALNRINKPFKICHAVNDVLPKAADYSGLVIMGGNMGVYEKEEHPWINEEIAFVKEALKNETPVLGICFGCQMLAEIHGGTVFKGEKGFSVGLREAKLLTKDDPIFGNELDGKKVYAWHGDTYTVGNGETLMHGVLYTEQAAKFKHNVYGVQFHPEITEDIISQWYLRSQKENASFAKDLPLLTPQLMELKKHLPAQHAWLDAFMERLFKA